MAGLSVFLASKFGYQNVIIFFSIIGLFTVFLSSKLDLIVKEVKPEEPLAEENVVVQTNI